MAKVISQTSTSGRGHVNNTNHGSRITILISRLNPDVLIGVLLFLAGLYAYSSTLAPTVLDGDAALFQYTPYVLGVTYPTGYPLYILLGKLWLTVFPFGELAWRMNLFSALCSAAALPLIYGATRRLLRTAMKPSKDSEPFEVWTARETDTVGEWALRAAALTTVLTFATLPTFWLWSTEAKIYALNILLFSGVLYSLTLAPLAVAALLLGLQISVHSTTVLLLPGILLFVWLQWRQHLLTRKSRWLPILLLLAPGLLYLYVPLRAEWLITSYGRAEAIARGLLADFYHSGLSGWLRYFTAADFTGGVVSNWGLVPRQFFAVYLPLLTDNLPYLGLGLGVMGGVILAVKRGRLFWPLFLLYAVPIPFVLTYGQGEQSAFLLPSLLIFSIFVGNALLLLEQTVAARLPSYLRLAPLVILLALWPLLFWPQTRYNLNWLDAKWSRAIYNEWSDALDHPLEPGAAVLAQWGDLTSFWYLQHAEGRRPDLRGLYPPTEAIVSDYLQGSEALYIAGPLQDQTAGLEDRFQLIPWGRLVRIAPRQADPQTLMPNLPQRVNASFAGQLKLLGVDYPTRIAGGSDLPLTLTWQALADLPPETTVSLRLSQAGGIVAQLDDSLLSGWLPRQTLPAGQRVLSYAPLRVPLGTLPGQYRLQLVTYTDYRQPWPVDDRVAGSTALDLGEVEVTASLTGQPSPAERFKTIAGHDFAGEIELAGYNYSVARVGQGKGFAVKLLWRARTKPRDNYTLLVEAVDRGGQVVRSVEHQPADGRTQTGSWQTGQFIRDQVDLVLPASAPVGEAALRVRLSWLHPDGSKLTVRHWLLPLADSLNLAWLAVTEKEDRVFEVPQVQVSVEANLANKARLIGYNSPQLSTSPGAGEPANIHLSRANCAAAAADCRLAFDFVWQGLSEIDTLYVVFIHLVDAQGRIIAQHDRGPGLRAKQPTTGWLPGEVVTDPVELVLPADISPGRYTLRLGMYLPPNGPRLSILNDDGQASADFVEIGTLEVEP